MRRDQRAQLLRRFPEVTWDRTAGDEDVGCAFGWIARTDGRSDFLVLEWNERFVWLVTSSARYSEEFWARINNGSTEGHFKCQRIAEVYPEAVTRSPGGGSDGRARPEIS